MFYEKIGYPNIVSYHYEKPKVINVDYLPPPVDAYPILFVTFTSDQKMAVCCRSISNTYSKVYNPGHFLPQSPSVRKHSCLLQNQINRLSLPIRWILVFSKHTLNLAPNGRFNAFLVSPINRHTFSKLFG